MSAQTGIEWCDSTFNPWMGCTKVSPACDHCYAERDTKRFGRVEWGAGKPRVRTGVDNWRHPKRWNDAMFVQCPSCGWRGDWSGADRRNGCCPQCNHLPERFINARRRVFCASLADWLDNEVPIEWLVDLLDQIRRTPNLDWLLLSKRIGNWRSRLTQALDVGYDGSNSGDKSQGDRYELRMWIVGWLNGKPPANVWIGETVVNQPELDRDLLKLYRVPAVVRFLSVEPMLSALSFDAWPIFGENRERLLHWVIAGGESGPHARPSHPDWYRSLRDQCDAAGVPFLFKQWGEFGEFVNEDHYTHAGEEKHAHAWVDRATGEHGKVWLVDDDGMWSNWTGDPRSAEIGGLHDDIAVVGRHGKKAAGRQLDGIEHNGFPAVLP